MNRLASACAILLSLLIMVSPASAKYLLTWSDIENAYVGNFGVPMASDGNYRFGYSPAIHAPLSNGNLLLNGHTYYTEQAEIEIPTILDGREATRVGDWIDVTDGMLPDGWSGGPSYVLGGMLELGSTMHFTKNQWYNAPGTDWGTQGASGAGYSGGTYTQTSPAEGMWTVDDSQGLAHHSRVGGYMSYAPSALTNAGYSYLAGLEGTSGAATGRWGPNLFAINPTPGSGDNSNALAGAVLMAHDSQHPMGDVLASNATNAWWQANGEDNKQWWIANKVTDIEWIETDTFHGVIALVRRGIGEKWYGLPDAGPNGATDPYGGGSGFHAEGWAMEAWIYDPDELMAVYNGEVDPWSLLPKEAVLLAELLPGASEETYYSVLVSGRPSANVTMSYRDGQLILLHSGAYRASQYESTPMGYVFRDITPEPTSVMLLGAGLVPLLLRRRKT